MNKTNRRWTAILIATLTLFSFIGEYAGYSSGEVTALAETEDK